MTDRFHPGDTVIFTPRHLRGSADSSADERGVVTSVTARYVFVRFGEGVTAAACFPEYLRLANDD